MNCVPAFRARVASLRCVNLLACSAAAWLIAFATPAGAQTGGLLGVPMGGPAAPQPKQNAPVGPVRPGFEKPGAPKNGPPPFLTEAVDWDIDANAKLDAHLFYPTPTKIDQAFYDLPFAVNVPFEVPFDGGVTRVFFDVNVVWDEPEQKTRIGSYALFPENGGGLQVHRQGIYALGGGALTPDSAVWEVDSTEVRKFSAPAEAPFPFLLNGDVPSARNRSSVVTTSVDINSPIGTPKPRRPFTKADGDRSMFASSRPLVLRAVRPGWYALWFTMNVDVPLWPPEKLHPDDTLRGKIHVHYIVARRERFNGSGGYFTPNDLDYLWEGRDVPPTRPMDPNLVRAYTVELPLVLRRDGWVLAKVELKRDKDRYADRELSAASKDASYAPLIRGTANPSATGIQGKYELQWFARDRQPDPKNPGRLSDTMPPWPSRPETTTTFTWDITLPREIPDGGVGEIVAKGKVTETGFAKTYFERAKTGDLDSGNLPWWMSGPRRTDSEIDKLGLSARVPQIATTRDDYMKYWAAKLGDPAATKYFPQPTDLRPPEKENEAKRYFVYAELLNPSSWFTRDPAHTKLLYKDLGPQPVLTVGFGPWEASGYYRRKKDVEKDAGSAPAGGGVQIANENDPFWKWYVQFCRLLTDKLTTAQAALDEAAPRGVVIHDLESHARKILSAVQAQAELAQGTSVFQSNAQLATVSEQMFTRMVTEARTLTQGARDERQAAINKMNEAIRLYGEIDEEMSRAYDRYGDKHPELLLWRRAYEIEKAMKRYAFAAATADMGVFREAVEQSRLADLDPSIRLYEARILRDMGDWPGAVYSLRRFLNQTSAAAANTDPAQVDPDTLASRAQAESMLRDIECAILKSALEKSQGALRQARENFFTYLRERGFSDRTPTGSQPQWWTLLISPWPSVSAEDAWATFTTGVTGAVSGILNKPGAEADLLNSYEQKMTTAFIGVHAILRLRLRGYTLAEIAGRGSGGNVEGGMSTGKIFGALPVRKSNGAEFSDSEKNQFASAVREALTLPEIAALLAEDEEALRKALGSGYWSSNDVTDTWAEWVGDITSPKNLLMNLAPMAVGTVGGVTQGVRLWSTAQAEAVAAMRAIHAAESGTVVMARVIGLERALQALRGTATGTRLANLMLRAHNRYQELGLIDKAIWQGGKAVAGMVVAAGIEHGVEKLAGKEAATVAGMLVQFAGDEELLMKFARGKGADPRVLAKLLDEHYVTILKEQIKDLKSVKEELGVWEKIFAEMKKGQEIQQLEQSAQVTMSKRLGLPAANQQVPTADANHNAQIALQGAAEGAQNSTNDGAVVAGRELMQDVEKDLQAEGAALEKAEQMSSRLAQAAPEPRMPGRQPAILDWGPEGAATPKIPPQPQGGSKWAQIEQAMHEGRMEDAEKYMDDLMVEYRRAAEAGQPLSKHELPAELWQLKRRVAAARVIQKKALKLSEAIGKEIDQAEREAVLLMERTTPAEFFNEASASKGSSGQVFFALGPDRKPRYVIKEVDLRSHLVQGNHDFLQAMAEGEMLTPELMRMLGFDMPAANVKLVYDATGKVEKAIFVSRFVDGSLLRDLSAEEAYAFRQQLSGHCAASTWVNNYDRKGDNYIITHEGRLVPIDAGQADPTGLRGEVQDLLPDDDVLMKGYGGRDHTWRNSFQQHTVEGKESFNEGTMKWFLVEQSLTYNEAQPVVGEINRLMKEDRASVEATVRKKLEMLFADAPEAKDPAKFKDFIDRRVKGTMDTLTDRAAKLDEAMLGLNARNQVALPEGGAIPSIESFPDPAAAKPRARPPVRRGGGGPAANNTDVTTGGAPIPVGDGKPPVRVGGRAGGNAGGNTDVPTGSVPPAPKGPPTVSAPGGSPPSGNTEKMPPSRPAVQPGDRTTPPTLPPDTPTTPPTVPPRPTTSVSPGHGMESRPLAA